MINKISVCRVEYMYVYDIQKEKRNETIRKKMQKNARTIQKKNACVKQMKPNKVNPLYWAISWMCEIQNGIGNKIWNSHGNIAKIFFGPERFQES